MKPTLQLRLGQSLAMTPQLQQAIRLLQLSTLELQQEIQQALDANPLLEQEESDNLEPMSEQERDDAQAADEARDEQDGSQLNTSDALNQVIRGWNAEMMLPRADKDSYRAPVPLRPIPDYSTLTLEGSDDD